MEPKLTFRGIPILPRRSCPSSHAMCSHWLGAACGKEDSSVHMSDKAQGTALGVFGGLHFLQLGVLRVTGVGGFLKFGPTDI